MEGEGTSSASASASAAEQILQEIREERAAKERGSHARMGWLVLVGCLFLVALGLNVLNARLQFAYVHDFFAGMTKICYRPADTRALSATRLIVSIQYPWLSKLIWLPFTNPITPLFLDLLIASGKIDSNPDMLCSVVCDPVSRCESFWAGDQNRYNDPANPYRNIIPWGSDIVTQYRNGVAKIQGEILMERGFLGLCEYNHTWTVTEIWSLCFNDPINPDNPGCGGRPSELAGDIMSNALSGAFLGVTTGGITMNPTGAGVGLVVGGIVGAFLGFGLNAQKKRECQSGG